MLFTVGCVNGDSCHTCKTIAQTGQHCDFGNRLSVCRVPFPQLSTVIPRILLYIAFPDIVQRLCMLTYCSVIETECYRLLPLHRCLSQLFLLRRQVNKIHFKNISRVCKQPKFAVCRRVATRGSLDQALQFSVWSAIKCAGTNYVVRSLLPCVAFACSAFVQSPLVHASFKPANTLSGGSAWSRPFV